MLQRIVVPTSATDAILARHRSVPDLRVTDLDVDTVLAFLDALETDRHNAIVTRNHRRTALQAFFRYLGSVAPEYLALCRRILAIPRKRAPQRAVDYLERAEVEALLARVARAYRRPSISSLPHSNSIVPIKSGLSVKAVKNGSARCGRRQRPCSGRS